MTKKMMPLVVYYAVALLFAASEAVNGASTSGWIVEGIINTTIFSTPPCDKFCVNVYGGQSLVFAYPCMKSSDKSSQGWIYDDQYGTLKNSYKQACLEAREGGALSLANCSGDSSQRWNMQGNHIQSQTNSSYLWQVPSHDVQYKGLWSKLQIFLSNSTGSQSFFTFMPSGQKTLLQASSSQQNLIQNGGFESVGYTNNSVISGKFLYSICYWTLYSSYTVTLIKPPSQDCPGNSSLDLTALSLISQNISTTKGDKYVAYFRLSKNNNCSQSSKMRLNILGSSLPIEDFMASNNTCQMYARSFTATEDAVNITFSSEDTDSNCGPILDDVGVVLDYQVNSVAGTGSSSRKHKVIIVAVIVVVLLCFFSGGGIFYFVRRRNLKKLLKNEVGKAQVAKLFSLKEIRNITKDFSTEIGVGGSAQVFLALSANGFQMAVKKMHADPTISQEERASTFYLEVDMLSRVHHRFIVEFLGYADEKGALIMLFEYMPNGSLYNQLHVQKAIELRSWKKRSQIAFEIAYGLEYLHHGAQPPIIHRDVKSANILLTDDFSAKVADFGLSKTRRLGAPQMVSSMYTMVKGSFGYLDPEYCETNKISEKSDVYSFGVVLLELITGRKAFEDNETLANWVKDRCKIAAEILNLLDPLLEREEEDLEEIVSLARVAHRCIEHNGQDRPTMFEVVKSLSS